MVVERALEELHIEGEFDEEAAEAYPAVVSLMRDVLDHGEVHATWADSDDEVEVRQGAATFDFRERSSSPRTGSRSTCSR